MFNSLTNKAFCLNFYSETENENIIDNSYPGIL